MNHPEKAIDKVLQALRQTEPPPGLERRLLRTLDAAGRQTTIGRKGSSAFGAFGIAACALMLCLASALLLHRPAQPALRLAASAIPASSAPASSAPAFSVPASEVTASQPTYPAARRPHRHAMRAAFLREPTEVASFPAPPMPLTAQERLLVELAGRGQPTRPATLNPDQLAQQEARNEASFAQLVQPESPINQRGEFR